jgi:hypothetical protein
MDFNDLFILIFQMDFNDLFILIFQMDFNDLFILIFQMDFNDLLILNMLEVSVMISLIIVMIFNHHILRS